MTAEVPPSGPEVPADPAVPEGAGGSASGSLAGLPGLPGLQRRLAEFAAVRGWEPFHTPKNLAAALSVEASELLEIFQWLTPEQSQRIMATAGGAHQVRDEVADVLAYLLQFCAVLDIDPLDALAEKIDRNEHRFPAPGSADRSSAAGGTSAG